MLQQNAPGWELRLIGLVYVIFNEDECFISVLIGAD